MRRISIALLAVLAAAIGCEKPPREWTVLETGVTDHLYSICAVGSKRVWAVGGNGLIIHSSNGGKSWEVQRRSGNPREVLNSVFFADAKHGVVVGSNGLILSTSDGGRRWIEEPSGIRQGLLDVFVRGRMRCAVGGFGNILVFEGGRWVKRETPKGVHLWSVWFADERVGCAVGERGTIMLTRDGGLSWKLAPSPTNEPLFAVHFPTPKDGWAVGAEGTIIHSSNGGIRWSAQPAPAAEHLRGVFFLDGMRGWAVGSGGTILHTEDGGRSWSREESPVSKPLLDVFVDDGVAWIAGAEGTVLKKGVGR